MARALIVVASALLSLHMAAHVSGAQAPDRLWLVAPAGASSPFSRTTTAVDLQQRFGVENLRFTDISIPEDVLPGGVLFPDDEARRVELYWSDPETRQTLEFIQIHGEQNDWKVAPGIGLGTSLAELERLNGRPFVFLGFGFDSDGGIVDWRGGRLEPLHRSPSARLRLQPNVEVPGTKGSNELISNQDKSRKLNADVWWITVYFGRD